MTWPVRHITQTIDRAPVLVSEYAGNPENLPVWATGVSEGIRKVDGEWVTDSPMGDVTISFTGPVEAGVLDHDVTFPDGNVVHNPLRVLRNGDGSEIVFTLYRLPGVSEAEFERDADMIVADLEKLKSLMESY